MKWSITLLVLVVVVAVIVLGRRFAVKKDNGLQDDWPPELKAKLEASQAKRAEVKAKHPQLFQKLRESLFKHDPIGINFESNTDEYDPEAGTIIPRLSECASEADVLEVVYQEFISWFGADTAGPKSRYESVAADVWKIWREARPGVTEP